MLLISPAGKQISNWEQSPKNHFDEGKKSLKNERKYLHLGTHSYLVLLGGLHSAVSRRLRFRTRNFAVPVVKTFFPCQSVRFDPWLGC